ncbi:hypothetical protein OAF82_00905 [bacterium]|nr:hypothetical protein [bacterium]
METYIKNTTTTALEIEELHVKDTSSTSDEIVELYRYNGSTADLVFEKPSTGPATLQTITWTITSAPGAGNATATISNTSGLDIISVNRTNYLQISGGPRLWNGAEAVNYGATGGSTQSSFGSASACSTWWSNYWIRARQNGGAWVNLVQSNGTIYLSCQTTYNNIGQGQGTYTGGTWQTITQNMVIDFEVYAAGSHP